MKTFGLIGGLAWPSTADYYRLLCSRTNGYFKDRGRQPPYPAPHVIIDSLNISETRALRGRAGDDASWAGFDAVFRQSFQRLQQAGAEFGAIASNTPHTRLDAIRQGLNFPIISILETTAALARTLAPRALVLGTPVIMRHQAYPQVLREHGVSTLPMPDDDTIDALGRLIDNELYQGLFDVGRERILQICQDNLPTSAEDTVVCLACTELPLAFPDFGDAAHFRFAGITFINTIVAHVDAILAAALANEKEGRS